MITGQVVDEQGEAVIGASVMVKGAKTGTITDLDGNFSVQGKAGQTLSISYVGYTPLDVKITKLQNNRFVLKENTEVLDEVVVVGMDTQKRNTITAAVSVVKGDDIVNRPITDLTSALQGNVAGLCAIFPVRNNPSADVLQAIIHLPKAIEKPKEYATE